MYKALDVRDVVRFNSGSFTQDSYSGRGNLSINEKPIIVVIAETEQKERVRFEFFPGYEGQFLGSTQYYGYRGDFDVLIPGDTFVIEDTSTWQRVTIITEEN